MSAAALICDTGALLDYLVASAPDHRAFQAAIDAARLGARDGWVDARATLAGCEPRRGTRPRPGAQTGLEQPRCGRISIRASVAR
jgi:hypothetical protein